MDVAECTNIVHCRIQKFEPENVTKIIGYLLLNHSHHEIVEYAYGPDELIHSLINEARAYIASSPKPPPIVSAPMKPLPNHPLQYIPSPAISRQFSFPSSYRVRALHWEPHLASDNLPAIHNFDFPPPSYTDLVRGLNHQDEFLNLEDQLLPLNPLGPDLLSNYYHPEAVAVGGLSSRIGVRSSSGGLEYPSRVCQYFYKGFCKHGMNCRYIHAQTIADNVISPMYSPHLNELVNDDPVFMAGSLEKLEIEITELLRARRGIPVSIASLPTLYQEMYGRTLQAEGYLTESQRHGKAGFNLTKLLARLKSSIRLIDRPHGQHSVILVEDAPKYMEYRNEKNDSGAILGSSHQIYLTFPAESTFTEEDVSNYFEQYGPVHDVRIPRQEKRMFGFVSFFYPETVKLILGKGHPHYICGARVLVKPYKEKSRITDKKFTEKLVIPRHYPSQYFAVDPDPNSFPEVYENSGLLEKQLIQDCEQVLELQGRRLFGLHLTPKPPIAHPYYDYGLDEVKLPDDSFISVPILKNCSTSDEKSRHTCNSSSSQDSGHIELPDSPFASPRLGGSISTGI